MATSGTYSFNLNRNQIIESALRKIGALESGQPVYPDMLNDAATALNVLVKSLSVEGIGLWAISEMTLFPDTVSMSYMLGPGGAYASCDTIIQTLLAFTGASGSNQITVASGIGLSVSMYIGIQLDNNIMQWTTISSINGNVVTLNANLSYSATQNNVIFAYTNQTQRPLEILEARRRDVNMNDTPLLVGNRDDYMMLSDKTSQGIVNQVHFQPGELSGLIYVWPVSSICTDRIVCSVRIPFQDFDNMPDNADFPSEALKMLVWNLAEELKLEYSVNPQKSQEIARKAAESKGYFKNYDTDVSFVFTPDWRWKG